MKIKFREILNSLSYLSVTQLVFLPILLGFLLVILWMILGIFFSGKSMDLLTLNVICFVFGLSGVPIIVKKELPSPWRTKGLKAVFDGLLILLAAWLIPILTLWRFLVNLFSN